MPKKNNRDKENISLLGRFGYVRTIHKEAEAMPPKRDGRDGPAAKTAATMPPKVGRGKAKTDAAVEEEPAAKKAASMPPKVGKGKKKVPAKPVLGKKIRIYQTEVQTTFVTREAVEIDTKDYPELDGMTSQEIVEYLKKNAYDMEWKEDHSMTLGEILNDQDCIGENPLKGDERSYGVRDTRRETGV